MKRNHANLGYSKKMDMKVGFLYPTYYEDLIPGDIARLGQSEVIRAVNNPTAPITDNFKYHTVYFAVPKRILDRHFVRNMTGTKTGDVHGDFKVLNPSDYLAKTTLGGTGALTTDFDLSVNDISGSRTLSFKDFSNGSLADYFNIDIYQNIGINANKINLNKISAYYLIWNFFFRNAEIEDAVAPIWDIEDNESVDTAFQKLDVYVHLEDEEGCSFILPRNSPLCDKGLMKVHWRKDYFTDVTLNSQRGTMPTVPITFNSNIPVTIFNTLGSVSDNKLTYNLFGQTHTSASPHTYPYKSDSGSDLSELAEDLPNGVDASWFNKINQSSTYTTSPLDESAFTSTLYDSSLVSGSYTGIGGIGITKDLNALNFSITDLRSALVISHFMEMNNTGGFKWAEFLMSHYGTCPTDETLERPLFLGSFNDDIFTSEVVQTSNDDASLGHIAGHMLGVGGKKKIVHFRAKEHMIILGLSWISCERNYESGVNRSWLATNYLDEYFSVFNGLGAQAIDVQEINVVNTSDGAYSFKNKPKNFAFNERYSHLMSRRNEVVGRLRSGTAMVYDDSQSKFVPIADFYGGTYENYYHNYAIGETYGIYGDSELVNGTTSAISPEFLSMSPQLTDIFTSDDVPFVCTIYNRADYFRPIPVRCKTGVSYV